MIQQHITLTEQQKQAAEDIFSQIATQRTTAARFKLPYTTTDTANLLYRAVKAEIKARHRHFQDNTHTRDKIIQAAQWLTTEHPSFGLFLCGSTGNGKTTLLYALQTLYNYHQRIHSNKQQKLPNQGFIIITAKELVHLAKAYSNPNKDNKTEANKYKQIKDIHILGIDDLGTEPRESLQYGDYVTAAIDLLYYRYQHQLTTIATSNLTPSDISTYYDQRIADRFREMMHTINFANQQSYRDTNNNTTTQQQTTQHNTQKIKWEI